MNSADSFFIAPLASLSHRREKGMGFLRASNGGQVGCRFVLEQEAYGEISLRCLLDTVQCDAWHNRPRSDDWFADHKSLTIDLETESGYQVENLNIYSTGGITNGQRQSYEFDLGSLDLRRTGKRPDERPVAFAEFSIVNYQVEGSNACVRFSDMWRWENDVIALRLGDSECWLRPVKGASDIIKKLEASKGIDVTATFMLPLNSLDEWNAIENCVDNLCTVLTLLSGNRVTWISARAIDSWGYAIRERWRNSVTNPYTTHDVLNTLTNDRIHHRAFTSSYVPIIEQMWSRFDEAEAKWNIRAAINTWHETVVSDHFLEQQGLLVAACMEMLRTRYLKNGGRDTILGGELFDKSKNKVGRELKKILKACFPAGEDWTEEETHAHKKNLFLMYSHVKSLNYFPFAESLKQMAQKLNMAAFDREGPADTIERRWSQVPLNQSDMSPDAIECSIKCFVHIRDHLTHQGAYILTADDRADEDRESSGAERVRQLQFLQCFTSAFLCSVLGWSQPLPAALSLPE
ncbi:MAG TPA: hypothetical protein VF681_00160 [Abditibacteriaceae bacterium]|jgi:hypothetical protein